MQKTRAVESGGIKVLDRVLDIIGLLAEAGTPLGLRDIARSTGISKSTVHRLLSALHA
ncbi:MAG: helix-turn-helix domain-containing protein, partial [Desulfovibrio sp.]|nr:helix-turn-helix domain-containing protein [Desulfovibrio sp.]